MELICFESLSVFVLRLRSSDHSFQYDHQLKVTNGTKVFLLIDIVCLHFSLVLMEGYPQDYQVCLLNAYWNSDLIDKTWTLSFADLILI